MFAAFPKVQAASGVVLEAKRADWCDSALVEIVIASKARQSRLSAAPAGLLRCARNDGVGQANSKEVSESVSAKSSALSFRPEYSSYS
jgi:hypothetical protein